MPRISSKNQVTIPVDALAVAGLGSGDQVTIEAQGPDVIVLRRASSDADSGFGVFSGLYPPDALRRMRSQDWS